MKKCTKCGKEQPDDAMVCPFDGQPLVTQAQPSPSGDRLGRYINGGLKFGTFIGVVGGVLYAMSDLNPDRGHFLNWRTNLILLSCPIGGSFIGYVIGRISQ